MNYEEIKEKYADKVRERLGKIRLAENKVERMQMLLDNAKAEKADFERGANGRISHEISKERNLLTNHVRYYEKAVEDARTALLTEQVGGNDAFDKKLDDMVDNLIR